MFLEFKVFGAWALVGGGGGGNRFDRESNAEGNQMETVMVWQAVVFVGVWGFGIQGVGIYSGFRVLGCRAQLSL